ncbi:hypothetical protein [Consotaella salsifontis]|nr:hypothetical protein [Consotaella salsifontis]
MRAVHLEDNLKVRFPGQDASFMAGVEIGMLATLMAMRPREFSRQIDTGNMEQARLLGLKMGYHVSEVEQVDRKEVRVTFRDRSLGPKLRVVSSQG